MKYLFLCMIFSCASRPFTVPDKTAEKIRYCAVGDVGTGGERQENVAKAMWKAGCERIVLLGDVIYENGISSAEDPQLEEKFFQPYRKFTRIYIVLGNHDYDGEEGAWTQVAQKDARVIHPASYFLEKIKDACLFYLDTNFDEDPELFNKERDWLRENSKSCKIKFAFTHHPFYSTGLRHGMARGLVKEFMDAEVIGKFTAVFSGHEHFVLDYGKIRGTRQIISGAGGKLEKGLPGFVILDLDLKDPEKSPIHTIFI